MLSSGAFLSSSVEWTGAPGWACASGIVVSSRTDSMDGGTPASEMARAFQDAKIVIRSSCTTPSRASSAFARFSKSARYRTLLGAFVLTLDSTSPWTVRASANSSPDETSPKHGASILRTCVSASPWPLALCDTLPLGEEMQCPNAVTSQHVSFYHDRSIL